jgi:hypothetical protein
MRKRLVIAAIAAVVIGVAAYLVSQPKEGTVEWHKRRFERGWKKMAGETRWDRILQTINRTVGTELRAKPDYAELEKQTDADYEALLRLGFVAKKYYAFTNKTLDIDAPWITDVYRVLPRERAMFSCFGVADFGSNVLSVVAPPEDIPAWEKFVAEADAPATK